MRQETSTPNLSLPHSRPSEQAVIGTILSSPSCIIGQTQFLKQDYFFDPAHQTVVSAICDLLAQNVLPDLNLVYERLRYLGELQKVGDLAGLATYQQFAGRPELIDHYLVEVKKYWELRSIVQVCSEIFQRGKKIARANIDEFLMYAEDKFNELSESRVQKGLIASQEILKETILSLEQLFNNPGELTGIPSGFVDLDKITAGFQPSDLIILAARPAMGKTALALNLTAHAALKCDKTVAFFSLEMSSAQLMQRMLATAAKIESHKFRDGKMSAEDFSRLYPAATDFQTDKILIDDTPSISIIDLASRCRKAKREKKALDLIIVDYLQLMTAGHLGKKEQNREREISSISMGLKALAKEMQCPVIALSQLNRGLEQRPDKRPRPSDLRESGSIEQDADQILFVYRDEVYHKDSPDKGVAEIIIGKNRHGALDTVKLAFQSQHTAFFNLMKGKEDFL